jgi:GT2 family glycosyltransferase
MTDGFIEASIRFIDQNDNIGIMGPMIFDEDGGVQGSARSFPTILTSLFGRNSPITKIFPNNSITRSNILTNQSDGKTPMEVDWVSGACMVVRREAMQAVGGFDERFFLYWEDTDLCKRIRDAGWKVVYFPAAKVIHSVGKAAIHVPYSQIINSTKAVIACMKNTLRGRFLFLLP